MKEGKVVRKLYKGFMIFRGARSGVAAVEFALIAPLMLLLYLGTFEVTEEVAVKRQVVLAASTVANLVTQYTTISASQTIPDILNASVTILTPFPAGNAVVTVSCINIDATGKATVAWSQALNGPARPVGQIVAVPPALDVPNTSLIFGETSYAYHPLIDFMHLGSPNLYSSVYMLPRSSTTVTLGS
jgi:Flp pilus assembly protein TadG